ncbi:ArsR/SmtB family transcription factor [Halonatronum saccharophilum]|uniref:ArsR/SmtB family transcription factor n=1 Tax=Halonatronum saccharophilum TaxID=150060 RepID=UPI0004885A4E|nr:metalloregulator ArsR/SmtB family transcription factor [Halonatronum saccharophilum]
MESKDELVGFFKALSDGNRLRILDLLSCGQRCVCDLTEELDLSQPNISHHLKILKNVNLIDSIKKGRWVYYSLNREKLSYVRKYLTGIINVDNDNLDCDCSDKCR